jgi:hypothetical protein
MNPPTGVNETAGASICSAIWVALQVVVPLQQARGDIGGAGKIIRIDFPHS